MDSPDAVKNNSISTATVDVAASSESPPVQESPFFSYVNNLSPIKSVKASRVAQDFPGLNSPPIVFTSPRINPHCGSQFLERPRCLQSATVGISQSDNGGKSLADNPDGCKKSSSLMLVKFISSNQKDFDIKNDANTQHCSSSPCVESVDKYLVDPADIDCMYSGISVNPDVKLYTNTVESKETVLKFDDKNGPSDKVKEPLHFSEESKKLYQEKPTFDDETRKVGEKKDIEWPSQECAELESTFYADLVFEKQCCADSLVQDVKDCEGCSGMGRTSYVSEQNMSQDCSKASQKHRGLLRRCLQFEEANAFGSLNRSLLPTLVPEDSKPSATSSDSNDLKTSRVALHVSSSDKKIVKLSKPITSLFSPNCSGNFPTGSKPSGIGLHLNSIVNAMPHGRPGLSGIKLAEGCMGSQGMKSVMSLSCHKVEDIKRGLNSSNMEGKSSVDNEDKRHERNASIAADSHTSESPSFIELPNLLIHVKHHASVHDERKLRPVNDGNFEDFNQTSPKRKKKRTSNITDDDGCKRCNCKKSKCLKLYCDCFAAGLYCAEPCACQGCFNKPEYEDLVLETRQQIESRNPLAFAPKIIPCAIDFPSTNMEDANLTTPSSARHKRGCNCKKSMCLKKYCECYQANVGCSGGCRCEGCKNVYGKKEEYFAMEHGLSEERVRNRVEEGSDSTLQNKLEMAVKKADLLDGELYDPHCLSPLTPSLQCSDQGKQAAHFRAPSAKYPPAPEMLRNDWQQDCYSVEITDQSSPRCSSLADVHELTHSNSQSTCSASFSSKARDQTHVRHVLSGGSLRWRSSPISPVTKLGETKSQKCLESGSRLYDILEDENLDILKEASTPIKSVKASSPKQKRVSPPQSNLRELGSGSSGGLRSGRKFILKAVPSFPPLTPCIDSKRNDHEDSGTSTSKQVTENPESRRALPM